MVFSTLYTRHFARCMRVDRLRSPQSLDFRQGLGNHSGVAFLQLELFRADIIVLSHHGRG
ncbi:hypothetical protein CQP30_18020 [Yersinia pestis]|nr:hypothetical protein CEQ20_00375 [Yersinia pseudotuberculosis]EFA48682.1 conserved hypothetical protein [Yersinia pestis KIM D27]EIQ85735.1 hypothetical protein YPPY01_3661 [Yersinia pestis PY-01]EIQ85892.1 hypothetical protein YPPY02_3711 [Yersinia pestis PY-02]EIQ98950.1 hypothetical protein YPPY04_3715 [Yersinia pestis PY-04]EIR03388.1 hypothetical protein YPPY06_3757 [Yersinia pestis PY-06]EIR61967.1 hypothetical protein YPPY25_3753 [Yersinia pestis PY-25]EIR73802.1 hypothetical prote